MSASTPSPSPERLAEAIVHDVLRRRRKGERVPGERVLQAYPDLRDYLEPLLRKADVLATAWNGPATSQASTADQLELQRLLQRMDGDPELPPSDQGTRVDGTPDPALLDESILDHRTKRATVPDEAPAAPFAEPSPPEEPKPRSSSPLPVRIPQRALGQAKSDLPADEGTVVQEVADAASPVASYRPTMRPPLGLLRVLDDDQQHAETIRLRKTEFVIGREQGDLVLPHDMQISARHAAIFRIDEKSGSHWILRDLRAANGVYLRVNQVELRGGDRFLLANALVRFVPAAGEQPNRLEEITPQGIGDTLPLVSSEHWIGRDTSHCERFLHRNPMLDQRMAYVRCDKAGKWSIHCEDSINGLWQRIAKAQLTSGSMFQLGEQRFAFYVS